MRTSRCAVHRDNAFPSGEGFRRRAARDSAAQHGFTLIEIIVVLAVLGLVLALVITHGPARSHALELDAAARSVAGSLRLARSRAIAEDRLVGVAFGGSAYSLDGSAPLPYPREVTQAGNRVVVFTPDGGSSGGRILLRDGGRVVEIEVDWLTGRAHLSEWAHAEAERGR